MGGLATSIQKSYESYPSNYVYALPADGKKKSYTIAFNTSYRRTLLTQLFGIWCEIITVIGQVYAILILF